MTGFFLVQPVFLCITYDIMDSSVKNVLLSLFRLRLEVLYCVLYCERTDMYVRKGRVGPWLQTSLCVSFFLEF